MCGHRFDRNIPKQSNSRHSKLANVALVTLLLGCIGGAPLLALFTKRGIESTFADRLAFSRTTRKAQINGLTNEHEARMRRIDPTALCEQAKSHYDALWKARQTFDRRYAISTREKALLKMRELSIDRSRPTDSIIAEIAKEAAPPGSVIHVQRGEEGRALDIEFLMSAVTPGEWGVQTKHSTVDSLRTEVLELVAKATYDVFQFCRDLDLASIRIGCRHRVELIDERGFPSVQQDLVLYKGLISRSTISVLASDPFLGLYSTRQNIETQIDDFENLRIVSGR